MSQVGIPALESARTDVGVRKRGGAFTIIEVLVASVILMVLVVLFANLVSSVSESYAIGKGRSDANNLGRALIDTMSGDLQNLIVHPDLGQFVVENTGSEARIRFYSAKPGVPAGGVTGGLDAVRSASVVEYILYKTGSRQARLFRRDLACTWENSRDVIQIGEPNTIPEPDASSEGLACSGVVGIDWDFLRANGEIEKSFNSSASNPVVGVRVSMAVVDERTLKILEDTGKLTELISLIETPASQSIDGIADWRTAVESELGTFPSQVATGLRFYERVIQLPVASL